MKYKLIVAQDRAKKRKVGSMISVLENRGLTLIECRKKTAPVEIEEDLFSYLDRSIFKDELRALPAMDFYRKKFSPEVLEKKISRLYESNVLLLFESKKLYDANELWENLVEELYSNRIKKLPLMFVVPDQIITEYYELELDIHMV